MRLSVNPDTGILDLTGTSGGGGGSGTMITLTGDTGGAVNPDGAGNTGVTGDTTQSFIQVNGTPGSHLLELKLIEPAADGELLIGNSATGEPSVANLTAGSGITIVNGNGSITIASTATSSLTFETDGTDAVSLAGVIQIIGNGVTTNGSGNTVTITKDADIPTTFRSDSGDAVPTGNIIEIKGTAPISTSASGRIVTIALATPLEVQYGGTGAVSLADGGILLGSGTSAITVTAQPTNGQLLIGSTGVDPVLGTLTAPAAGLTITEGAGSITFALADDLAALEAMAGTGIVVRSASDTYVQRTIAGTAPITVTNGDGVSGNPTVELTTPLDEIYGGTGQSTYTTGDILYASAANTLSKLAIDADETKFLGISGGIPAWEAAPGGGAGAWTLVDTGTFSGDSEYDVTDLTAGLYVIELKNVKPSSDTASTNLQMLASDDNGVTFETGNQYQFAFNYTQPSSTGTNSGNGGTYDATNIRLAGVTSSNQAVGADTREYGVNGWYVIENINEATPIHGWGQVTYNANNKSNMVRMSCSFVSQEGENGTGNVTSVDALRFKFGSENLASGTIRIWRIEYS